MNRISVPQQYGAIRKRFQSFRLRLHHGEAIMRGKLQPRDVSPVYEVEIRYRLGHVPRVRVLRPRLDPKAPHLYKGGYLCLYWPKEWQWSEGEWIAKTIVPWTALWLHHYELWQECGRWFGPSSHGPPAGKEKQHER